MQQPVAQRLYRTATHGEAIAGIAWLCLGAVISMFLEVIYLGTWMFGVAVPYTIPIAFFFNMVLTRTALLWTKNPYLALSSSVRISAVYYSWWPGPWVEVGHYLSKSDIIGQSLIPSVNENTRKTIHGHEGVLTQLRVTGRQFYPTPHGEVTHQ